MAFVDLFRFSLDIERLALAQAFFVLNSSLRALQQFVFPVVLG